MNTPTVTNPGHALVPTSYTPPHAHNYFRRTWVEALPAEERERALRAALFGEPSKPRIYVAGPMTGLPDYNYPRFNQVTNQLRTEGFDVENPAETDLPPGSTWHQYMVDGLTKMLTCQTVLALDGWETSKGATIEVELAKKLGLTVITETPVLGGA